MTYTKILDDDEARDIAAENIDLINTSRAKLLGHVATRGKTISSRWKEKSRDKRDTILLEAMPDLEKKQWIMPRFLKEHDSFGWDKAREVRKTWLLYWLDVESLQKEPARLLGLIYNRARFSAEEWAPHDNENLHFGFHQGFFVINFSELCVVMHGDDYGKMVPWENGAAHRLDIIGFPRGQLILEAQIPKVEFKKSGHVEMWSSYINHPFSEPPRFDIDALVSAARARRNCQGGTGVCSSAARNHV
ncbi:hypothetical protein DL98DRAFT_281495 [Cadophora sp. DSE1049]|nr:hypothetical protein DL98DRAFT_281495 [Cadophora sp. DSE1049]